MSFASIPFVESSTNGGFVDVLSSMKTSILSKEVRNISILFLMELILIFWLMVSNPSLVVYKKSIVS